MDIPDTSATLGTQDTGRRQANKKHSTTQKTKQDEQHEPHQKTGSEKNPCARKG